MRAPLPTTRATHPLAHLVESNRDTTLSRLLFLGGGDPADPFVARKRRNVLPNLTRSPVTLDRFAKI